MATEQREDRDPRPEGFPPQEPAVHRRRARYPGTHPRRFDQRYKELDARAHPEIHEHIRAQGRTPAGTHVAVLVREVLASLRPAPGELVADCTIGYGGHAMEFLKRIGTSGRLIGFDVDGLELERARRRLADFVARMPVGTGAAPPPVLSLHRGNYAGIGNVLAAEGIDGCDIIFADLGVSSMQVDDPSRGFSYKHADGPLDMRMDGRLPRTAADLLMALSEEELSAALWELSDEPDHLKIAQWIVRQRQVAAIQRTGQLIRLIFHAKNTTEKLWRKQAEYADLHPAARTFQALRILVNDELGSLRQLLRVGPSLLRPGGRIGIISFHSGEDRLVKNSFRDGLRTGTYAAVADHVIRPGAGEVRANPRSSSAKFRWARVP